MRALVVAMACVFFAAGTPAVGAEPRGEDPALSLREAIARARLHHPSLRASRLLLDQAQAAARSAEAEKGPRLTLTSALSGSGQGEKAPQGGWDTKLAVSQPLFDAFKAQDALQLASLLRLKAESDLAASDLALQYDVSRFYLEALRAQAQVSAAQLDIARARSQVGVAKARLRGGAGTELDVLQVEALLASAQDRRLQAQATHEAALNALEALVGQAPQSLRPDPGTALLLVTVDGAGASAALLQRPDLRTLEINRRIQELTAVQRSRAKLPTLEAGGNVGASPFGGASYGVTGTLSWGVFDAGRLDGPIAQARLEAERAAALLEAGRLSAILEIRRAQAALRTSEERVELTGQQQAASARALQLSLLRFERGVGTSLETLQALTSLNQAQSAAIAAKFDDYAARLKLTQALGLPVEAMLASE
ncbi:MAG TPA: TolC family protein [Pantanalinema sp.]